VAMMVGPSSSGTGGAESFLAGVLPVCVWRWSLVYDAPAYPVFVLTLKSGVVVTGAAPRWSRSLIGLRCTQ
jgi:hypothetical protein